MATQSNFLGSHESLANQREHLHRVLDLAIDFKTQSKVRKDPAPTPEIFTPSPLPTEQKDFSEILTQLKNIADKSTNFGSPSFVGFPDSGNSIAALSSAIFYPFLNQNMINQDFCAPEATFAEMEVIHWLRKLVGYNAAETYSSALDVGGCSVTGGVLANTIALLVAREKAFPGTMESGVRFDVSKAKILVASRINHYSIKMAMAWLGLGQDNIVEVPIDANFRLNQSALAEIIKNESLLGNTIIACVAYAGDSRTMAVDDFVPLAAMMKEAKIHFHIDACHGLQLLFSPTLREKMRGAELSDSITFDPHKVLWIPYCSSFVLFKNPDDLRRVASSSDLITKEKWSLGQTTPFLGSKDFHSLKLWSLIKHMGIEQIGKHIEERLAKTGEIAENIKSRPELKLINETDINSCMFVYYPSLVDSLVQLPQERALLVSNVNYRIKEHIRQQGKAYVHGFPISLPKAFHGLSEDATVRVLRIMNGNPNTSTDDIDTILDTIVELGNQFIEKEILNLERIIPLKKTLVAAVRTWCKLSFPNRDVHAFVYGSSVLKSDNQPITSDLDMMFFLSQKSNLSPTFAETFVRALHARFNLRLDNEIPYARKLVIPEEVLENALSGAAFPYAEANGRIRPVQKTKRFLESDEMRARLILNVFTSCSELVFGDKEFARSMKARAAIEVTRVALRQFSTQPAFGSLFKSLFSNGAASGEEHLGYKEHPEVRRHVRQWLKFSLPCVLPLETC